MNLLPRAFESGAEDKVRRLVFIRLLVATLVVGAAVMAFQVRSDGISAAALYGLLGVMYVGTGAAYLAYSCGVPFPPIVRLLIGMDLGVLTLLLHYSGGSGSIFSILYILPIFMGGFYFQVSGGMITSLVAASVYIVFTLLEVSGHAGSPGSVTTYTRQGLFDSLLRGYVHMGVFIGAGLVSGYFSRRVMRSGLKLADREKEIKQIQLSTDSILNNMSSGLIVIDLGGSIVSINPAGRRILGIGNDSPVSEIPLNTLVPGIEPLYEKLMYVIETGNQVNRDEVKLQLRQRGELPLGVTISLLKDEDQNNKGVIALFQDLTKVHRMREKIRKSDRMAAVGELSAAIAHEIRAPLASICGSIEMLKDEIDVSGENAELMDLIIKESDRLDGIITDFLEYAKLRKPEFEKVDVENCAKETTILLKHGSHLGDGRVLKIECESEGLDILADEEQIRQVFLNLGLNACEVVGKEGTIVIRIRSVLTCPAGYSEEMECVMVDFINDGPPISSDVMPRIFEPFFTTKDGGTGLGLAMAARIVESHSGTISVEKSDDKETVFRILLPVGKSGSRDPVDVVTREFYSV